MSRFYNYDARGPSHSSQIITLERMLEKSQEDNDRLRSQNEKLRNAAVFAFAVLSKIADEDCAIAADTLRNAIWPNICGND